MQVLDEAVDAVQHAADIQRHQTRGRRAAGRGPAATAAENRDVGAHLYSLLSSMPAKLMAICMHVGRISGRARGSISCSSLFSLPVPSSMFKCVQHTQAIIIDSKLWSLPQTHQGSASAFFLHL